jgi:hypothetical protein
MSRVYIGLVVMLVALSGCKNDSESAMSEMISKQKDMLKILKGITDKDSAIAAKPKLEALQKEARASLSKYDKQKINEDQIKKAAEKYKSEEEEIRNEIMAEMRRIVKIPGAAQAIGGSAMSMP